MKIIGVNELELIHRYYDGKDINNIIILWTILKCNRRVYMTKYILHRNHDVSFRLTFACRFGNLEAVKSLVKQGGNIHFWNELPLRWACSNGHLHIVNYLIKHGANIHAMHDEPLRNACRMGQLSVTKYLIAKGANIHRYVNKSLEEARGKGQLHIVKYLLRCGIIQK